jgi:pyruvate formate lyase activating enzyme
MLKVPLVGKQFDGNKDLVSETGKSEGMIFNVQRYSTEDGPGIRTTVFMKGCPLRCPWCQNPEGLSKEPALVWYQSRCVAAHECVKVCQEGALKLTEEGMSIDREKCTRCGECVKACPAGALELIGKRYNTEELLDEILRDRAFYEKSNGGITFGGGEPMLQVDFLENVLPKLKETDIYVAIDTCGAVPWEYFERIIDYVDLFLFDLKLLDEGKFKQYTGGNIGLVTDNARQISSRKIPMWIRTPIIPGYTDDEENIKDISEFINRNIATAQRYELLSFNNMCKSKYERLDMNWELKGVPLIEKERMEEFKKIAEDAGVSNVRWSGPTRMEVSKNVIS